MNELGASQKQKKEQKHNAHNTRDDKLTFP